MIGAFTGLFRHDLRLALRQGGDTGLMLGFFVLAVVLFPLGVGPEPALLQRIGAGIIWVAALLAALLSLDRLFEADYRDGGLELLALSEMPLELAVLVKCAAHWVLTGLPLAVVSPLLALFVDLEATDDPDPGVGPGDRHARVEPDRCRCRCVDPRSAAPGGRAVDPGTAALCAAARLWCGCRRGQRSGHRRARQSADSRRVEPRCPRPLPLGERCGIASGAGLRFGSTTPSVALNSAARSRPGSAMINWLANPARFTRFSAAALPWCGWSAVVVTTAGPFWSLVWSPPASGSSLRICSTKIRAGSASVSPHMPFISTRHWAASVSLEARKGGGCWSASGR